MSYTEQEEQRAYAVIAFAKTLPIVDGVSRLFSLAMCFYRHPVGDAALDAVREMMGAEQLSTLMYISGLCSATPSRERWAELAGLEEPHAR